jgi:hypothetical protein
VFSGPLDISSATLAGSAATLDSLTLTSLLVTNDDLELIGAFTWGSGELQGTNGQGSLTLLADASLNNTVSIRDFTLSNAANMTWTGGTVRFYGSTGGFHNAQGATFTTTFDGTFGSVDGNCLQFVNDGHFVKTGGTGITSLQMQLYNRGTVEIQRGQLYLGCGYVTNNPGTPVPPGISYPLEHPPIAIDPGPTPLPPDTPVVVPGSYTQTVTGLLIEQIAGYTGPDTFGIPGTDYGQLVVNGDVALNGSFDVQVIGGFVPTIGQQYMAIDNRGSNPIDGIFIGLPEGEIIWSGDYGFTISYDGGDGNDVVLTMDRFANSPPVADAGGPYSVLEGQSLTLDASASSDPDVNDTLTYAWDLNGDNDFSDASGVAPTLSWNALQNLGIDDGLSNRTVRVLVSDPFNHSVISTATVLTLKNAAPTATPVAPGLITYGGAATFSLTDAFDPSATDTAAGFHYAFALTADALDTVTYDSGSGTGASHNFTGLTVGEHTLYARVFDKDNGYTQYSTTIHVDPKVLVGTVSVDGKIYDATTSVTISGRFLAGVLDGDDVSYVGGTAAFADKNVGTNKSVTVTGLGLLGSAASNYVVNSTAVTTANIAARQLTITATADNKIYDGTSAAVAHLSDNRIAGDVLTAAYASAAFSNKHAGTTKPVSISGISLSGPDSANYSFNGTAIATADISPRSLVITAQVNAKIYDGNTTAAAIPTFTGLQAGDSLTGLIEVYLDPFVGTGKTLRVTSFSLNDGNGGNNYSVTSVDNNAGVIRLASSSVFVLNPTASGALSLSGNASVNATNTVRVNSNSSSALTAAGNAQLIASRVDVVGGVSLRGKATVAPIPTTGAAWLADPFSNLAAPVGNAVTGATSAIVCSGNTSLAVNPGTYTRITASGNCQLVLHSGVYILGGGGLSVSGNASISGNEVMLYNAGSNYPAPDGSFDSITISGNGTFHLSPPTAGAFAGVTIFQARDNTKQISLSGNSSGLTGTIYAPVAQLSMTGNDALQMALVVDRLRVSGNGAYAMVADTAAGETDATGIITSGQLNTGVLWVSFVGVDAGSDPALWDRFRDAIATINQAFGVYGVTLIEVDASNQDVADIRVVMDETSPCGSYLDGVLGCSTIAGEITLLQGWDWYTGNDPTVVDQGQYDYQSIITHELGHAIGVEHSSDAGSTMYDRLAKGETRRSFTAIDLQALAAESTSNGESAHPLTAALRAATEPSVSSSEAVAPVDQEAARLLMGTNWIDLSDMLQPRRTADQADVGPLRGNVARDRDSARRHLVPNAEVIDELDALNDANGLPRCDGGATTISRTVRRHDAQDAALMELFAKWPHEQLLSGI